MIGQDLGVRRPTQSNGSGVSRSLLTTSAPNPKRSQLHHAAVPFAWKMCYHMWNNDFSLVQYRICIREICSIKNCILCPPLPVNFYVIHIPTHLHLCCGPSLSCYCTRCLPSRAWLMTGQIRTFPVGHPTHRRCGEGDRERRAHP